MPRLFAFLRAINVGGHTVKMDRLRGLFERMGLTGVETFIASGNVAFEAPEADAAALATQIETALAAELGYAVATFVRTEAELLAVAQYAPFAAADLAAAPSLNVGFMAASLSAAAEAKLLALRTSVDEFHAHGAEIYWLCRVRQNESKITLAGLERAIGQRATFRGVNTVRRMAAKYVAEA